MGTTAVNLVVDFGTGWRIMDGVEGNGVDMAAAASAYSLISESITIVIII